MLDVPFSVANNLWIVIAALLVFIMAIAVGFLEVGELGEGYGVSLTKTILVTCTAVVVMAIVGFNTAFAPTIHGIIGNPIYPSGLFLGGFSSSAHGLLTGIWWSMGSKCFGTGLATGSYFLFEAAFASVTLALVYVVALKKIRLSALLLFGIVYFIIIWNLPAAWIWNPTGWLYIMGMRDFAGGLIVHGAAGATGFALVLQIWREERTRGFKQSPSVGYKINQGWLTLAILLLWMGWFGFNPGSVLAFNSSALTVVLTTFLAASVACISTLVTGKLMKRGPDVTYAVNGILMGLIVITPLAGFVSPSSSMILGIICGPLFVFAEMYFSRAKWFTDPIGLFPGHFVGGIFGILMIAFFTQHQFAVASGNPSLPDSLLFGGGYVALHQLGIEIFGLIIVLVVVFLLSFAAIWAIGKLVGGITDSEYYEKITLSGLERSDSR